MSSVPAGVRWGLRAYAWLVLGLLYAPLLVVAVFSFNTGTSLAWPPKGFTGSWWAEAVHNDGAREALLVSLRTAALATLVALVLGTCAAFAIQRFRFFGREPLSLMLVLPIALPGIVTGIALNAGLQRAGIQLGILTLVVAHATFCIVVVFNNVVARLRRMSPNLEEASADLGAHRGQTFLYVTFPLMRSALVAGGLLALGLSFDEIVVTTFTAPAGSETLPQWILNNLNRGEQQPIVNVVATAVMLLSVIPVWLAQRLTGGSGGLTGRSR
ncbi:MAG: potC1 [Ilumatobacteraceae bacterium]|nr:potC1 [Ilumatobacteraceae bacterium]